MYQNPIESRRVPTVTPAKGALNALERAALATPELAKRGELIEATDAVMRNHRAGLDDLLEFGSEGLKKRALLDLVVLQRAIEVGGGVPPAPLKEAITEFAGDLRMIPALNYELIILVNPAEAVRTFTTGPTGEVERSFYLGHQEAEARFENLCHTLTRARNLLEDGNKQGGLLLVEHGRDLLAEATREFHDRFGSMSPEAFNNFRIFLTGAQGYEGPSGLHSATVHASRFLIYGGALNFRADFIERHRPYYPTCHEEILEEGLSAVREGRSLVDLARASADPEVRRAVGELAEEMRLHTTKHFAVVKKMLSDLSGPGTGGQPMGVFLRQAFDKMKEVSDELVR